MDVFCKFLLLAVLAGAVTAQWGPNVVDTNTGKIAGKLTDTARVFTSVPYARKPERWKDPEPPLPWPGILQTTTDPPGCPQTMPCKLPISNLLCPKEISEDCLFLNVYTPLTANTSSRLPVMVFFHGGNFIRGYSNAQLYNGEYIANTTSTIVVTVNYRLGALGFLVYGDDPSGPRGNYGLRDQRLALQWVQSNIAYFGGDPNQVTAWGQSAGAVSIAAHMSSVRSAGLFNKAIIESEPFSIKLKTVGTAKILGNDFAKELGCSDLDCLNKKNMTEIANAQDAVLSKIVDIFHVMEIFLQWTPIVDGLDLSNQPLNLLAEGVVAPIPIIIGTTSEESLFFIYEAFGKPVSGIEFDALELAIFEQYYSQVHRRYPPDYGGVDNRPLASVMGTDYTFTCPTRFAVKALIQRDEKNNPVWLYNFNHSLSFDGWGKDFSFCDGHSCHGAELPFVFHTAELGGFKYSADELAMADQMITYWTTFAHRGDPNPFSSNSSVPYWPAYRQNYTSDVYACMRFKTPKSEVVKDFNADTCDFWDTTGYSK